MKTVKITIRDHWWEDGVIKEFPLMERSELEKIHTKQLLKYKPYGLRDKCSGDHVVMHHNFNEWAVNVEDYMEVLASRPHVPNKAEAKKIRQDKAKQRR